MPFRNYLLPYRITREPLCKNREGSYLFPENYDNPFDLCAPSDLEGIINPPVDPPVVPGGSLHSVTFADTSGTGSDGFVRFGLAFEKAQVPAGSILTGSVGSSPVPLAMLNRNTWSDGSLKSCAVVANVGAVPSSGEVTLDISAEVGAPATSAIPGGATAFLQGMANDLTVEVRNHSGVTDSIDVGNLDFSLQNALVDVSRIEILDDTDLVVRGKVWEQVGADQHLICEHHFDLWLDTDGATPIAVEWTPVLSQHWWISDPLGVSQTRQRRDYDATIKEGASTLAAMVGLQHAYHCRWAGLRLEDDAQHGKRFWVNLGSTAMPTLNMAYSLSSRLTLVRAGYLPPQDFTETYSVADVYSNPDSAQNGGITDTYTPLGRQGHKQAIIAGGGYVGRGFLTDADGKAITVQTAQRWREARAMAQASLSVFHHQRDHRVVGSDPSNKIFPPKMAQLGAQTYPGLAAEVTAVSGSGGELPDESATGGRGAFSNWDEAHHTVYGYMMAFVEGEQYLSEAVLSNFDMLIRGNAHFTKSFDGYNSNPKVLWAINTPLRSGQPQDTYGSIYIAHRSERAFAWSQLSFDHADCLMADNDPQKPVLANLRANADGWLAASIAEFTTEQLAHGSLWTRNPPEGKQWMQNWIPICYARACVLAEDTLPGFASARDIAFGWSHSLLTERKMYASEADLYLRHRETGPGYEGYLAPDEIYTVVQSTDITSSVLTFTHRAGMTLQDNDTVIPYDSNTLTSAATPAELTDGTTYHVINAAVVDSTTTTCQLSLTQGGSAITFADTTTNCTFGAERAIDTTSVMGLNGTYIAKADDFATIFSAAAEYMWGIGSSLVTQADINAVRTWAAPAWAGGANFSSWRYNGDNMRPEI